MTFRPSTPARWGCLLVMLSAAATFLLGIRFGHGGAILAGGGWMLIFGFLSWIHGSSWVNLDVWGVRWKEGSRREGLSWERIAGFALDRRDGRLVLSLAETDGSFHKLPFVTDDLRRAVAGRRGYVARSLARRASPLPYFRLRYSLLGRRRP